MNPFDWPGPQFLLFYVALGFLVIATQLWLRHRQELAAANPTITVNLKDPLMVAYLAGGVKAVIRCVMVSLLERKALRVERKSELKADKGWDRIATTGLERAICEQFAFQGKAVNVFGSDKVNASAGRLTKSMKDTLEAAGLLPDEVQRRANLMRTIQGAALLFVVAAIKLGLAVSRGKQNIGFLIVLAVVFPFAMWFVSQRRSTAPGRRTLQDLRHLFANLKTRTRSGNFQSVSPADAAFVTAVFGVAALGGTRSLYAKELFHGATGSTSSCGSSCGSASSSSDGGGGGGCGGGCGGCGGS